MDTTITFNDTMTLACARDLLCKQVAADDTYTRCPCCNHRARNDKKGMTRWQATALDDICAYFELYPGAPSVHAATLLENTPGSRDHGVALLRHWGLLRVEPAPEDADPGCKGSRGLTGWYSVTELGWAFRNGKAKVHKNIVKDFGAPGFQLSGPLITFAEALTATENTDAGNIVVNGTTQIDGVDEAA